MSSDEKTDEKPQPASKRDKAAILLAVAAGIASMGYMAVTGEELPSEHVCECPEAAIENKDVEPEPESEATPAPVTE